MKAKKLFFSDKALINITILFSLFLFSIVSVPAQNNPSIEESSVPIPSEETFQDTDAIAAPWRSSGCPRFSFYKEPDCYEVKSTDFLNLHILSLFDEKGSLWYQFSVSIDSPDNFSKKKHKDFLPFATSGGYLPSAVFLRLVGESPNWYKVEVNEETRDTKYILKKDPMWAKTSWERWLFDSVSIDVDFENTPLHDKPNGKILENPFVGTGYRRVHIRKSEGEWVAIDAGVDKDLGWVRWRNGRKTLVKLVFEVTNGLPSTYSGK